jgi:hypothetical protein
MTKRRGSGWWVVVYAAPDPLPGKKAQKTGTAPTKGLDRPLKTRLVQQSGMGGGKGRAAGSRTVGKLLDASHEWRPRTWPRRGAEEGAGKGNTRCGALRPRRCK